MPEHELYLVAGEIQIYAALLLKFFNQALEERLRQCGTRMSVLQHSLLRMLQFETLTISELSQRLGLDPSTLVRSVDNLERKDLARRGTDPQDRRRNPISITEKGKELIASFPVIADDDLTYQVLQSLGCESAMQLRDLLRRLIVQFPEGQRVAELLSSSVDQL